MEQTFEPKPVKDCFHVFSDGTRVVVLCDTEQDSIYMMNQIAVAAFFCQLRILSLEVMRTHFHVIVIGSPEKVEKFRRELKRLIIKRYKRDGLADLVKNSIDIRIDPILDDEELRRKIIYVFRNCTEAGFEYMPEDYPWGPGAAYCRQNKTIYRRVGELTYRDQCRMFRTRVHLPPEWASPLPPTTVMCSASGQRMAQRFHTSLLIVLRLRKEPPMWRTSRKWMA